jgi:hypothetical protein
MSNYNLKGREKYKKTERGFVVFGEFKDRYDSTITVQESSIAFEPCVWVFTKNSDDLTASPHLTPDNAKRLIEILQDFVEQSKLEDEA